MSYESQSRLVGGEMKTAVISCAFLLGCIAAGCDSGSEVESTEEAPETTQASEHTQWQASGTFPVPVYGITCRLTAGTVYTSASNGADDDTLTVEVASDGSAVMHLRVVGGEGEELVADHISMARGKKNESFRHAVSDSQWPITWGDGLGNQGTVLDGTLCFSDRLTEGEGVNAEFSLILETADGEHHTVGGTFALSSGIVTQDGVPQTGVNVDLQ